MLEFKEIVAGKGSVSCEVKFMPLIIITNKALGSGHPVKEGTPIPNLVKLEVYQIMSRVGSKYINVYVIKYTKIVRQICFR